MAAEGMTITELQEFSKEVFAPMIQQMNIQTDEITQTGAQFSVAENDHIVRGGDIICGQAVASIADTVGVLTLMAHNPTRRVMTTVELTTHFARPLFKGTIDIDVTIVSNGKKMATLRIDARQKEQEKVAATTTCLYFYI